MKRSEVPAKYKWNLNDIVGGDAEWEKLFAAAQKDIPSISAYAGKLADREILLECFKRNDELAKSLDRLFGYAHMKADEDTKNGVYKGMSEKARSLYVRFSALASYITPELTALPADTLKAHIADPDFADYDYALAEILRQKAHILSDKEEKLLAMAGDFASAFHSVFSMIDDADVKFKPVRNDKGEKVEMSHGVYSLLPSEGSRMGRRFRFIRTAAPGIRWGSSRNAFGTGARSSWDCHIRPSRRSARSECGHPKAAPAPWPCGNPSGSAKTKRRCARRTPGTGS